jgi:hypothetical protein
VRIAAAARTTVSAVGHAESQVGGTVLRSACTSRRAGGVLVLSVAG